MLTGRPPQAVQRFVDAAAKRDFQAVAECFTEDATVTDEGRTHRGRAQIRKWQEDGRKQWEYILTVRGGRARGADGYLMQGHLSGNFPGGEADVRYDFTLRGGLISHLAIS
ncbi:MAG TPA: nuclear transport factor 2 family protein [Candidatus Acidoferrales bacterium]|nr:nuclear transport factor 2 family protein [Candidatus Acidoferrales bacterium]